MMLPSPAEPPVVVVSGGSSGIGLATVRTLLDAGWRVAFFGQQRERVESALEGLTGEGRSSRLHADVVDLRDVEAVGGFFLDVRAKCAPVGALVCNAGFSPKTPDGRVPLAEIPLAEWQEVLSVNLTGALLCCQAVLPGMMDRRGGRIVLIGSVAGRTLPRIAGASYVASKAALSGLARSLVSEYSKFNITTNTVCPGRILTEMAGSRDSAANVAALSRIPVGRLGAGEDIARVVEFLLRAENDFINGAIIDVNGGEFVPA